MTRSAEATDTVKNFVSTGSSECGYLDSTGTSVCESAGSQANVSFSVFFRRRNTQEKRKSEKERERERERKKGRERKGEKERERKKGLRWRKRRKRMRRRRRR